MKLSLVFRGICDLLLWWFFFFVRVIVLHVVVVVVVVLLLVHHTSSERVHSQKQCIHAKTLNAGANPNSQQGAKELLFSFDQHILVNVFVGPQNHEK